MTIYHPVPDIITLVFWDLKKKKLRNKALSLEHTAISYMETDNAKEIATLFFRPNLFQ